MLTHPKIEKLLGLSKKESRILSVLTGAPKNVSQISKEARYPRTTTLRTLIGFHSRGFVAKHRVSLKRGGWVIKPTEGMEKIFKDIWDEINSAAPSKISRGENDIVVYHGKKQMMLLANKVLSFHKGERVYWMQSIHIWEVWLKHKLLDRVIWLTHYLKNKGIISEGFFPDNFLEIDYKYGGEKLLRGFLDRPVIIHTIPSKFLNFYSDIMVFRDVVSIMNWKDELAIEIKNKDLVKVFISLFDYIKATGVRVNLQEEVTKILNSKKQKTA